MALIYMDPIDPVEVEHRLERLKTTCQVAGMRMTHQRMEIFREVAQTGEHPDADTVFKRVRKRMPTVSHDTVYRTLASLEGMGLLSRVAPFGGRARYDANCDKHHHFICTECGGINDIYLNHDPDLPKGISDFGQVESVHVQFRGTCNECKNH